MPTQTPGTGPAGPVLTPSEWAHVEALCIAHANAANAPIRTKIGTYFHVRALHAFQADARLGPMPRRGHSILPAGTIGNWHPHPYRHPQDPDRVSQDACTVCGYPRAAGWHTEAP